MKMGGSDVVKSQVYQHTITASPDVPTDLNLLSCRPFGEEINIKVDLGEL